MTSADMGGDEEGKEKLSLVANRHFGRKPQEEDEAIDDAYGLLHGQREATMLRLIRHGGKPLSAPYHLLSFVWGDYLPHLLLLEYAGFFTVRLRGPDLIPLEPLISKRRVTWIRACGEEEALRLPVAVTAIDVLRFYPSRQVAIDPDGLVLGEA